MTGLLPRAQHIPNALQLPKGTVPNPPGTGKKALAKIAMASGVALAAIPKTCHKWLSHTKCLFQHPPALKGRTDLLPLCPEAAGGSCPRLAAGQSFAMMVLLGWVFQCFPQDHRV